MAARGSPPSSCIRNSQFTIAPMTLTSASQIKRLLSEHGLRPKKRLGQSFLIDRNTLNRILEASEITPEDNVLEIGAGLGTVTRELAAAGAGVVCVELDRALLPILETSLADVPPVEIVAEDFLKLQVPEFLRSRAGGRWVVVGNLPYYVTSPIITKLIDARSVISRMLLMVQREVAGRLQAKAGSEEYGALTVFVQQYCDVSSVMKVSRNVFYPVPEVDSEVVRLSVRERPQAEVTDEQLMFAIVRAAFGKRRKTLLNALSGSPELGWDKERARAVLDSAGIDGDRRGETLSIEEFARVAEASAASS